MTASRQVIVELVAKTDRLNKGFKEADRKVNAFTKSVKRLGGVLAGVFGAQALFRGFQRTLKQTDDLIKLSKGIGFTVDEYQKLVFSLDQVGVAAGSAKIAIGDFQKRLSKAVAGVSPQFQKAFEQAGLDTKALSRMTPAAAFNAAMGHLATMRDDPRIAGMTGNVFEEQSGKDVLQVLRQWEKYVQARGTYSRRVEKLNQSEIESISRLNDEVKLLGAQWDRLKIKVVADAAPEITEAIESISDSGALKLLTGGVVNLIDKITELTDDVKWLFGLFDGFELPDWVRRASGFSTSVSPQGMLAAPANLLGSVREAFAPKQHPIDKWRSGSTSTTTINNRNEFKVGRGSGEISDKEARTIRKAFDAITSGP